MNENIIFNPLSIESYPHLSDSMTIVKAAQLGSNGIVKDKRIKTIYSRLELIAQKAFALVESTQNGEKKFHRNFRFLKTANPDGSYTFDIIVSRVPYGAKSGQAAKINIGYMHNPHWRFLFDADNKMISCASFSNPTMQSTKHNFYDDICIHTTTYNNLVKILDGIFNELSEEVVEFQITKKVLDARARRAAKKEKAKQKAREIRAKEREKVKAKKLAGKGEKKYYLTKRDGSKKEVSKEEFLQFQAILAQRKRIAEMENSLLS